MPTTLHWRDSASLVSHLALAFTELMLAAAAGRPTAACPLRPYAAVHAALEITRFGFTWAQMHGGAQQSWEANSSAERSPCPRPPPHLSTRKNGVVSVPFSGEGVLEFFFGFRLDSGFCSDFGCSPLACGRRGLLCFALEIGRKEPARCGSGRASGMARVNDVCSCLLVGCRRLLCRNSGLNIKGQEQINFQTQSYPQQCTARNYNSAPDSPGEALSKSRL